MAESTIPSAPRDWLNEASDALLGAGLNALNRAVNPTDLEKDTKTVRADTVWPWQKIAMIAAVVIAGAFVLRLVLKR